MLHECPPLFYPAHDFVPIRAASPLSHDAVNALEPNDEVLVHMAAQIQDSICLRLDEVSSGRERAALQLEAHSALAWLRAQEVRDWYEGQDSVKPNQRRFMTLLEWIAQEAKRIGEADGCFITLNYVVSLSSPKSASPDTPRSNVTTLFVCRDIGHHW